MQGCETNTGRLCCATTTDDCVLAVVGAVGEALLLIDKGRPVAEVRDALGRLLVTVATGVNR